MPRRVILPGEARRRTVPEFLKPIKGEDIAFQLIADSSLIISAGAAKAYKITPISDAMKEKAHFLKYNGLAMAWTTLEIGGMVDYFLYSNFVERAPTLPWEPQARVVTFALRKIAKCRFAPCEAFTPEPEIMYCSGHYR